MRAGDIAWCAIGAGVLTYEVLAPEDELLSESVDRALLRRPTITRIAITLVACHLLNLLPTWADPFHYIGRMFR